MTSLFDFSHALEERKGILADSNIHDDALAYTYTEAWRHECEVRDIVKKHYPDGHAVKCELDEIEKKRGKESADKLRADCRKAWQIEIDNHKAMRENAARDSQVNK